jgi:hypothetical protein
MILNATGRFLVQCGGGVLNYAGNMDSCTDFMWTLPWGKIYENLRERRVYVKLGAVVTLLKIYHLTNCGFSEIQCCELLKSNHFHKG